MEPAFQVFSQEIRLLAVGLSNPVNVTKTPASRQEIQRGFTGLTNAISHRVLTKEWVLFAGANPQSASGIALRVEVDQERLLTRTSHPCGKIYRSGRFANASFPICDAKDSAHEFLCSRRFGDPTEH
jgi:hypothetical protein